MANFTASKAVDDQRGCCFGNCTHVWNYETDHAVSVSQPGALAAQGGFRILAGRAGRHAAFRQMLPDGIERSATPRPTGRWAKSSRPTWTGALAATLNGCAACGPRISKASAVRVDPRGLGRQSRWRMEGVQHNTYDVEFYGPNPLSGIYYLGALRAAEEMARVLGDTPAGAEYRELFETGSRVDGRESVQRRILRAAGPRRFRRADRRRDRQRHGLGATPKQPEFQLGAAAWRTS